MALTGPGAARLRKAAALLVAVAVSGLIVLVSSYSAFNTTTSNPTVTTSNPAR